MDKPIPGTWNISHSWKNMALVRGGRGARSEQAAPGDACNISRPGMAAWTRKWHLFPYYIRGCMHAHVHRGRGNSHAFYTLTRNNKCLLRTLLKQKATSQRSKRLPFALSCYLPSPRTRKGWQRGRRSRSSPMEHYGQGSTQCPLPSKDSLALLPARHGASSTPFFSPS